MTMRKTLPSACIVCRAGTIAMIVKNNPLNMETIISQESVHKCRSQGKICVLDIDSQGVRQLKEVSNLSPVYVFVKPPSMSTLEERLRSRKTETEESLRKRLDAARQVCEAALNLWNRRFDGALRDPLLPKHPSVGLSTLGRIGRWVCEAQK